MKCNFLSTAYLIVFLQFISTELFAQANPNPCSFPDVTCQNGGGNGNITSFGTKNIIYPAPGRSMPFWAAYGDTLNQVIDTDSVSVYALVKREGPGEIEGTIGTTLGTYRYFNDISFTKAGLYELELIRGLGPSTFLDFTVLEEENFCTEAPGGDCVSMGGDEIYAKPKFGNVIPVDAVFPIKVGVINSINQMLDSSFTGTIYVEKVSGPGIIYGSLSMSGKKWFNFENFKFSEPGDYVIRFQADSGTVYKPIEIEVEVISTTEIDEVSVNPAVAFPNPFSNVLKVETPDVDESIVVSLFDYTGKVVIELEVVKNTKLLLVNTEDLKPGVFILSVKSATFQSQNSIVIKQ